MRNVEWKSITFLIPHSTFQISPLLSVPARDPAPGVAAHREADLPAAVDDPAAPCAAALAAANSEF
jgi:hypothetical protein